MDFHLSLCLVVFNSPCNEISMRKKKRAAQQTRKSTVKLTRIYNIEFILNRMRKYDYICFILACCRNAILIWYRARRPSKRASQRWASETLDLKKIYYWKLELRRLFFCRHKTRCTECFTFSFLGLSLARRSPTACALSRFSHVVSCVTFSSLCPWPRPSNLCI